MSVQFKMRPENKNKAVADKIIEILRSGLTMSADMQHYIDSTFSNPSAGELKALLQDESNCERDSLLALVFYPDEPVQLQLEEMIADTQFQDRDEQDIQNRVCSRSFQTQMRFADDRGTLEIKVTPSNVAQFIERLNLSRHLDPKIRSAIARYVHPGLQTRCKVRFRNTRPITSPEKISFLQAFFEKLQVADNIFLDHLDFALGFLDELKDEPNIYPALMARKKFYFRSLQKAKKLEIQLTQHNVETLLLRGRRLSYVDKADVRKKILIIDRISLAVFGKTEFFDLVAAGEQTILLEGKEDIDNLMKELS